MIFSCCTCGEDFATASTRFMNTCSVECRRERERRRWTARNKRNRQQPVMRIKKCAMCGDEFKAAGNTIGRKTCSLICSTRLAIKGQEHRRRLEALALETVHRNFPGLDLSAMFEEANGRPARGSRDLGRIAVCCIGVIGDRDQLERDLKAKGKKWKHVLWEKTCAHCGEQFHGRKDAKTCSEECSRHRATYIKTEIRRGQGIEPVPVSRDCVVCGKPFRPLKCHVNHITCSKNCADKRHYQMECEREGYNQKYRECAVCAAPFKLKRGSGHVLTCSKECRRLHRRRYERDRRAKLKPKRDSRRRAHIHITRRPKGKSNVKAYKDHRHLHGRNHQGQSRRVPTRLGIARMEAA